MCSFIITTYLFTLLNQLNSRIMKNLKDLNLLYLSKALHMRDIGE